MIPSIQVVLTQSETGFARTTATDANGLYLYPLLPVGTYALNVNAAGFRRYERNGFVLNVNQHATLDIALQIGDIAETVKVTAEAPLLNMRSSEVGALMDPVRLTELPLNGRNPLELVGLLPGVQGVSAPDFAIDTKFTTGARTMLFRPRDGVMQVNARTWIFRGKDIIDAWLKFGDF